MANFFREFFGLVFPGFQPPPPKKITSKIHAQNCWHSSPIGPISLSRTRNLFTPNFCLLGRSTNSETGRIRFRRVRFQTPNSVSCLALTEFWGESSVSSFRPISCGQNELTEFFAELAEFAAELSEFSLPKPLETVFRLFPTNRILLSIIEPPNASNTTFWGQILWGWLK